MLKALPDSDSQPPDIAAVPAGVLTRSGSVITTAGRALARVLTAAVYISAGYEAARAPGGRVGRASDTLTKIRRVIPLPVDDELIVRANGAAQFAAGTTLALGVKPRLSAAVLAASLLPTTVAGHAFWTIEDPLERRSQQLQFLKNMAMLGGLLFATIDSPRSSR
ncbi:MAG TPA: DoxX family protein [Propionibacteriaceae bacterium]|nr:DoxX family protein [Propionibacteriaceae bacterium]